MTPEGLKILAIEPDGIAGDLGLTAGDRILSIDDQPVQDMLDLRFLFVRESLWLRVAHLRGGETVFEIHKDPEDDLGARVEPLEYRRCSNRCIFCFVHQNPPGLRSGLYFKDEDYRLSFLDGNYVTLSHAGDQDLRRILSQRLSPLFVSIHSTDAQIRGRLLGWSRPCPVLPSLKRLLAGGIEVHGQIVVCPGWNDRERLGRTFQDLMELEPRLSSVAVVPVGLTVHRRGLPRIEPPTADWMEDLLQRIESVQRRCRGRWGTALFHAADEIFLQAGKEVPPLEAYEDLPQLANGVGLVALWRAGLAKLPRFHARGEPVVAVTGRLAAPLLETAARRIRACGGPRITVLPVENRLFGSRVTVSGLLGGEDLARSLKTVPGSRRVLIPDCMLKVDEPIFLDDWTLERLAEVSGRRITVCEPTVEGLLGGLASRDSDSKRGARKSRSG